MPGKCDIGEKEERKRNGAIKSVWLEVKMDYCQSWHRKTKKELKMKRVILALIVIMAASSALAGQTYVNGYTRQDGTYVQGHTRTTPDEYRSNNRGSQSMGGHQRDEFSDNGGATNKRNQSYGMRDNDGDGRANSIDLRPDDNDK